MKKLILMFGLTAYVGSAGALTTPAGTGALSYTYFNLSPGSCTLNYVPPSNALNGGSGYAGFFNVSAFAGSTSSPESLVTSNYIFYDSGNPITAPSSSSTASVSNYYINTGGNVSLVEYSAAFTSSENPAAMADQWTIQCLSQPQMTLMSTASATNMLASNAPSSGYPYDKALAGVFENAKFSPGAPGGCTSSSNPCGMGITTATGNTTAGQQNYNFNPLISSLPFTATGGLWMSVNANSSNPNNYTLGQAVNTLNYAMYPVNLSAYVPWSMFNANVIAGDDNVTAQQVSTPVFGGHFTLAIGDPFIVSSFSAKILAYLVGNSSSIVLDNSTTLNTLQGALAPNGNASGVFAGNGTYSPVGVAYVKWLMGSPTSAGAVQAPGSPQLAANAYQSI